MESEYKCAKKNYCCYYHENDNLVNKICSACVHREKIVEDTIEVKEEIKQEDKKVYKDSFKKSKKIMQKKSIIFGGSIFFIVLLLFLLVSSNKFFKFGYYSNETHEKSNNSKGNEDAQNNISDLVTPVYTNDNNIPVKTKSNVLDVNATDKSFEVLYKVNTKWDNNIIIDVIIKNNKKNKLNNWKIKWDFDSNQKIEEMWNAEFVQEGKTVYIKGKEYNNTIVPNNSVTFGFKMSFAAQSSMPKICELNGVPLDIENE